MQTGISRRSIRQALRVRLRTISPLPTILWENKGIAPPNPAGLHVRETLIWGDERFIASNMVGVVGIVQYDIFGVKNEGTEAIEDLSDTVKNKFSPGVDIAGGFSIAIDRSTSLTAYIDDPWFVIPVQVTFRAYANRAALV